MTQMNMFSDSDFKKDSGKIKKIDAPRGTLQLVSQTISGGQLQMRESSGVPMGGSIRKTSPATPDESPMGDIDEAPDVLDALKQLVDIATSEDD